MVSNSWADFVAALHGALLILAALVRRQEDGRGIWIDMSQYEANVLPLGHLLLAAQESARAVGRWGNRSPGRVPQGCYRCQGADAWCVISVGDEAQWRALVEVIDDEALRSPNYHSTNVRWRDHDLIDRAIEAWTGAQPALQVEEVLRRADVPAAAVRTNLQVLSEIDRLAPSFRRMPHPLIGEVPIFPNAIHLDGAAPTVTRAGPLLGEDTAAVLHALLGMSAQDVERLRADGALA